MPAAAGRRCADTLACILSKKARAVSAARTFRYLIFFIIPGSASQRSMSQKLLHSTPAGAGAQFSPYPGVDEGDEVLHHLFRVGGIGALDAEIELHLGLRAGGTHADPGVVFQLVKEHV